MSPIVVVFDTAMLGTTVLCAVHAGERVFLHGLHEIVRNHYVLLYDTIILLNMSLLQ